MHLSSLNKKRHTTTAAWVKDKPNKALNNTAEGNKRSLWCGKNLSENFKTNFLCKIQLLPYHLLSKWSYSESENLDGYVYNFFKSVRSSMICKKHILFIGKFKKSIYTTLLHQPNELTIITGWMLEESLSYLTRVIKNLLEV